MSYQPVTGALFSPCGRYRYRLWRRWTLHGGRIMFVMLNPSTADETANDPTVERCQRRAKKLGYGALEVCNIFALRSTDPKALYGAKDPVGPENDNHLMQAAKHADTIVCGWGNHGKHLDRGVVVRNMLLDDGAELTVLHVNGSGEPTHPLYIAYDVQPYLWDVPL